MIRVKGFGDECSNIYMERERREKREGESSDCERVNDDRALYAGHNGWHQQEQH